MGFTDPFKIPGHTDTDFKHRKINMFAFKKGYFIIAVLLFLIEVLIALFIKDQFIRPYVGDFLAVILIYCFLKSFWDAPPLKVAIYVLLFSFAIEIGQHFQLVKLLGLNNSQIARTVIGVGFDWADMLAYTLGVLTVLIIERYMLDNFSNKNN